MRWFAVMVSCLFTYPRRNLPICLSPFMFEVSQDAKNLPRGSCIALKWLCLLCSCFDTDEHGGYYQAVAVAKQCHYFLRESETSVVLTVASHGCFVRRLVSQRVSCMCQSVYFFIQIQAVVFFHILIFLYHDVQ